MGSLVSDVVGDQFIKMADCYWRLLTILDNYRKQEGVIPTEIVNFYDFGSNLDTISSGDGVFGRRGVQISRLGGRSETRMCAPISRLVKPYRVIALTVRCGKCEKSAKIDRNWRRRPSRFYFYASGPTLFPTKITHSRKSLRNWSRK